MIPRSMLIPVTTYVSSQGYSLLTAPLSLIREALALAKTPRS